MATILEVFLRCFMVKWIRIEYTFVQLIAEQNVMARWRVSPENLQLQPVDQPDLYAFDGGGDRSPQRNPPADMERTYEAQHRNL